MLRHGDAKRAERDRWRGNAAQRGYNQAWREASRVYLQHNPLCRECWRQGRVKQAEVTDHIKPHKGDSVLFWLETNWQPLCAACHNAKTAREDGGFGRAVGIG